MSAWDYFSTLNTLKIDISNDSNSWNRHKNASIYDNGKNQATIYIKVNITGLDGNRLIIPEDELLKAVYLVHYEEGNRLNRKGDNSNYKPWIYTDENFGYDKLVSSFPRSNYPHIAGTQVETLADEQLVKLYLYATEEANYINISVGIDIPGVGNFNTSKIGTKTKNGPKGVTGNRFSQQDYISIYVVKGIDYSQPSSIEVESIDEITGNIEIKKLGGLKDIYYPFGQSSKEKITVKPASKDNNFIKVSNIENLKADLKTVKFYENVFPDIIVGRGGIDFTSYFVFVQRKTYGLMADSHIYSVGERNSAVYKYTIDPFDERHYYNNDKSENNIQINVCKHKIALNDVGKFDWNDQNGNATFKVDVIDTYGNNGTITIQANYGIPSKNNITVNGK